MGKYDIIDRHLHDRRDVLADLLGAELHERCTTFPPTVGVHDWADAAFEKRFRLALPDLPAPDSPMIAQLCNVLDLEIDHEVEEIDRLIRAGADRACCPTAAHVETFHFLWRTLLLHLEERGAELADGLKRKDKHRAVNALRKRAQLVQLPPGFDA